MADQGKAIRERKIFGCFLTQQCWPDDMNLFESRNPPEPDILYNHPQEGNIAFELAEICAPEIKKELPNLFNGGDSPFIRISSSTRRILSKKLSRIYETEYPIELLCYAGAVVEPNDVTIAEMMPIIECSEINFRRIWFFGDKIHCLYFNKQDLSI